MHLLLACSVRLEVTSLASLAPLGLGAGEMTFSVQDPTPKTSAPNGAAALCRLTHPAFNLPKEEEPLLLIES